MRKLYWFIAFLFLSTAHLGKAQMQEVKIDRAAFFLDDNPIEMVLSTDIRNLLNKKAKKEFQPATATLRFPDSTQVAEEIRIQTRGVFRLANCDMPSLMLHFKNPTSPRLSPLKKLKLVCGCGSSTEEEQLIIKEYLAYKIYNLLTPMSFRVRLVKITYADSKAKKKPYTQYGFLIEDVDDLAERNNCLEQDNPAPGTNATGRHHMTLVAIFQYMIGNLDWSVPGMHNIKLIRPKEPANALPLAVPYDFDYCGLVNAPYAVPPEQIDVKSVTERVYRGFPRSMDELEPVIENFKANKEKTMALISNCQWLSNRHRREMTNFLEDFYRTIDNKNRIKNVFIDNARTQ